ncbi:GAF domain-containing protein, partial [bacterium]
ADTRRWAHEMEMLVRITTDLRAALTRAEVVPAVLDSLVKLYQAEAALMSLKDTLSGEQVVELGRGAWIVLSGRSFPSEKGPIGRVAARGKSYLNNDLPNAKAEDAPRLAGGLQALACVPLIAQEQTLGTLAIGRSSAFSEDEFHILETIADIVASAIQRANLFDQTERRLRQVQSLRTIDMAITADMNLRVTLHIILDQVMVQLRVDAADILLFQPNTQTLEYTAGLGFRSRTVPQQAYHLGDEIAGRVAQERRTLSVLNFLEKDAAFSRSAFMAEEGMLSYFGVPMVAKGQLMGVLEIFHRSTLNPEYEWLQLMEALSVQAAIAINNAELFEQLQLSNQELVQAYDTTLEGWARALELRDRETEGHSRRVTALTVRLAKRMGFSDAQLVHVRRGALLHDIGKMGIPDGILFKPGLLDEKEWEIMRMHPTYAYQLLAPIAYLQSALEIPYSHHERWDGTGYPLRLKGEEIPLAARIFAVVDVWDALISDRPYQQAWEAQKIRDYLQELAGKQLDARVVKAFLEMLDQDGPDADSSGSAGKAGESKEG